MANGMFIRVTHLGASDGSLLLSDIFDATDGAIHELQKAGPVYVPENGSAELVATSDVIKSFESGSIRKAIDESLVSASFERGDEVGQTLSASFADGDVVAFAALGKIVSATIVTSAAADAGATMTIVNGAGEAMVTAADAASADGAVALTVADEAADLEAGRVITCTWDDNAAGQGCTLQITFAG